MGAWRKPKWVNIYENRNFYGQFMGKPWYSKRLADQATKHELSVEHFTRRIARVRL